MNIWDKDIPCYVFVEETEQFMQNTTQGKDKLFHLPALPFACNQYGQDGFKNLDESKVIFWWNWATVMEGISTGFRVQLQSMKEMQRFINVDDAIEILQNNRFAKKSLVDKELLPREY